MSKKPFILIFLLATSLIVSACGNFTPNPNENPETQDYYRGSQGVMMRFSPGTPPPRFYYYSDSQSNEFDISVELHNEGSSDAFGALFISGFSPHMVKVEANGVEVGATNFGADGSCTFSLISMLKANCRLEDINTALSVSQDKVRLSLNNVLGFLNIDTNAFVGVEWDTATNTWEFGGGFFNNNLEGFDRVYHGPGMILGVTDSLSKAGNLNLGAYNGIPFGDDGILLGDNYYYPGGEHNFQTFTVTVDEWPQGLDETNMEFGITSCYAYTTYAAPMLCIDPNPYAEGVNKVCTPKEYSWSGSQGAPVAITGLKQDPTPKSTFLTFTVRNVGPGKVMDIFQMPKCSPYYPGRVLPSAYDTVYIGDVRIGGTSVHREGPSLEDGSFITCTPKTVRLIDGVGSFTCEYRYGTMNVGSKTAYETPVVVELWYGYREYMQQSTHIKRVG